ncbi:putative RNA recognition motif domain, nucleotide-binding alpha-beta plait domain superfamily [Helianthus annuus]|nr:putative RNA recognition motif domain, nucleotide-binding alpha-beta plait domain superfamily [Helianthus annuus]
MEQVEEPWIDVIGRRKVINRNGVEDDKAVGSETIKFYISNLPPGCRPWDVADFVRVYGEVSGMYIARKRDKAGNRFGFLSFKNVKDAIILEKALNGLKMGGYKLSVNIARFANENIGIWKVDGRPGQHQAGFRDGVDCPNKMEGARKDQGPAVNPKGKDKLFTKEGKSFKDILAPTEKSIPECSRRSGSQDSLRVIEVHKETSAFFAFQERAVIGRSVNAKMLAELNVLLASSGFGNAKVYYAGGLYVLIVFPEDYEALEFVNNGSCWESWFSSLDMWVGQSLPFERIAWLKFVGVLVHLAENKVFDNMAEYYGKVVYASHLSPEVRDLSVNRVGVLVDYGEPIVDSVFLSWQGRKYKVWISEEQREWVPDCIAEDDSKEKDDDMSIGR